MHALTPDHGKSVLASYLLGSRLRAMRAAVVAGVLSLTHVGSAVILALLAAPLITCTLGGGVRLLHWNCSAAEFWSQSASGYYLVRCAVTDMSTGKASRRIRRGSRSVPVDLVRDVLGVGPGVPEAGLMLALAMMIGVGLTLSGIELLTILTRDEVVGLMASHVTSLERLAWVLDGLGGLLLIVSAAREIWR